MQFCTIMAILVWYLCTFSLSKITMAYLRLTDTLNNLHLLAADFMSNVKIKTRSQRTELLPSYIAWKELSFKNYSKQHRDIVSSYIVVKETVGMLVRIIIWSVSNRLLDKVKTERLLLTKYQNCKCWKYEIFSNRHEMGIKERRQSQFYIHLAYFTLKHLKPVGMKLRAL